MEMIERETGMTEEKPMGSMNRTHRLEKIRKDEKSSTPTLTLPSKVGEM